MEKKQFHSLSRLIFKNLSQKQQNLLKNWPYPRIIRRDAPSQKYLLVACSGNWFWIHQEGLSYLYKISERQFAEHYETEPPPIRLDHLLESVSAHPLMNPEEKKSVKNFLFLNWSTGFLFD